MINEIFLVGNVGQDSETKVLSNGSSVCTFSLATSESYKDKDGNWQNITQWHHIVVWGKYAESLTLNKGETVAVVGTVKYRKYTDKNEVERSSTDIVARTVRRIVKKDSASTGDGYNNNSSQDNDDYLVPDASGDDLPF